MSETAIDPKTALVLIDLQKGIAGMPTVHPAADVIAKAAKLARAFRERGLPVVLVNVDFAPDFSDAVKVRADAQAPAMKRDADFSDLVSELDVQPSDILITKRNWGAFYGTALDLQLRRRGITQIVLGGIATSIGVESTARAANEHAYQITFVSDAMTDRNAASHDHSVNHIFTRIGQVRTTDEVLAALHA